MAWWNAHHWTAIYIAAAIFILYKPPGAFQGVGAFIKLHFGDSMGVYMLHLAIALVTVGSVYKLDALAGIGNTLLTTAMAILKFTKDVTPLTPPANLPPKEETK